MDEHDDDAESPVEGADDSPALEGDSPVGPTPWWARLRIVLPGLFTTVAGAGVALALIGNAYATTLPADRESAAPGPATQQLTIGSGFTLKALKRDAFSAYLAAAAPSGAASAAAITMPTGPVAPAGEAQQYAAAQIAARGWAAKELACLVPLWGRESGWNAHAGRPNGPYGIPQAYPGSKMAAAGGDWLNDHRVQIRWGLGYIAGRYGTPCGAWAHWQSAHSY